MTQHIAHDGAGRILFLCDCPDGLTPMPSGGRIYRPWSEPFPLTPPTPTSEARWADDRPQWFETADLLAIKARKRAEITQDRLAADADHFVYQGKAVRSAEKDILDLLIADARWNKGKPANWPGGWLAIDNSYVIISTKEQWDAFFVAMYDAGIDNFMWSQQLKARVLAAQTPDDLATIQWAAPTSP